MRFAQLRRIGVVVVTVAAASAVTAPAWADSGATLSGTVVDALTGKPVSAEVVIEMPDYSNFQATNSDEDGQFSIDGAVAGNYQVEVQASGYITQWANGHTDQQSADLIAVPGSLQVSLMPIQYGSIGGTVATDKGKAVGSVGVELDDANGNQVGWTASDKRGAFQFADVQTGSYFLGLHYPSGLTQWYADAESPYQLPPVVVNPNANTALNVVEPPFGAMRITVEDSTGAPLAGACVYYQGGPLNFQTFCTDASGKAKVTGIPVGTYAAGVSGPDAFVWLNGSFSGLTVTEGHTATTTVKLKKAASVHLSFVDAATGQPVDGTSLFVGMTGPKDHNVGSPYISGSANGADLVGLPPSKFKIFVGSQDGVHGAQWVGPQGGTGNPDAATTFSVTNGDAKTVTVRLDGAGSVTGTVTSAVSGAPVAAVCPTAAQPYRSYGPAYNSACTDSSGTYTISNLGPYDWKLAYPAYSDNEAWAWSGGGADRAKATAVHVVASSTITANVALPATGKITGKVTIPDGDNVGNVDIWTIDAATGDYAGVTPPMHDDGTFTIGGLNTQSVWLYYTLNGAVINKYPTKIKVTAGGTITGINLAIS